MHITIGILRRHRSNFAFSRGDNGLSVWDIVKYFWMSASILVIVGK